MPGSNILKDSQGEFQLFNTAYFISNDGSILGSYRQKNLWHTERTHINREGKTSMSRSILPSEESACSPVGTLPSQKRFGSWLETVLTL